MKKCYAVDLDAGPITIETGNSTPKIHHWPLLVSGQQETCANARIKHEIILLGGRGLTRLCHMNSGGRTRANGHKHNKDIFANRACEGSSELVSTVRLPKPAVCQTRDQVETLRYHKLHRKRSHENDGELLDGEYAKDNRMKAAKVTVTLNNHLSDRP